MHSYGIIHADVCLDNIALYKPTPTSLSFHLFNFNASFDKDDMDGPYEHDVSARYEHARYEQTLSSYELEYNNYKQIIYCGRIKNNLFLDDEMLLWSELRLIGLFPNPENTNIRYKDEEKIFQIQKNRTDIYLWKVNFLLFSDVDYYLKGGKKTPYPSEIKELIWMCRFSRC